MRQVWIPRPGPPEVLEVREAPDPSPGRGEVRIRATAVGVNFADVMARLGLYPDAPPLPCVVGYEAAGRIDALGPGVTGLAEGQRVAAVTRFGGYADVLVVPADQVAPIGERLSDEQAAAAPVQYLTAWLMLVVLAGVRSGERVLVHSAGGGVGLAALDICRWRGAEVIGTASAGKHDRLRELGVAHCIDYRAQDFEAEVMRITGGEGVDVALDAVGGRSFARSYRCLRQLGRLYCFGASSLVTGRRRRLLPVLAGLLRMPSFKPLMLMDENRGVHGVNLGHLWHRGDLLRRELRALMAKLEDGTFSPRVDATFPFDRAAEAHAYIQARRNFGKVLLTPS